MSKATQGEITESPIFTPDRRLRVFISSTLKELQEEREAARSAVDELHLTPVMFEAGARPHPPQDLYRAYLKQSDVFVGIYGESYGWVAPGMDRSGIEDEYLLSGDRPKLIYVKSNRHREPRLDTLLGEIADAGISYRHFDDSDQLRRLLGDDLAVLLSERFARSDPRGQRETPDTRLDAVPIPANEFIGRRREVAEIIDLVSNPDVRLVTIGGPGGVGKSRLALEVAARLAGTFDNMTLTLLEDVVEPEGVVPAILSGMGISESALPPLDAVKIAVSDRPWLFVVDNFEHVSEAATDLGDLLELVPTCKALVTSRVALAIRAEHLYTLEPLAVPEEGMSEQQILATPSVELFVSRAEAAGSKLVAGSDTGSLARLARLLEGVPLSLELAAGRARVLSPFQILERLERSFGFLSTSAPDLPQRHHSIEATIQWSFDLLTEAERAMAGWLSVFEGGFTVEDAAGVCGWDILDGLSSLVAKNLIHIDTSRGEPRLAMLRPIRGYATWVAEEEGMSEEIRVAHARHFLRFAAGAAEGLRGPAQIEWLDRLSQDDGNVTAAIRYACSHLGADVSAASLWDIYPYLEYMGECREAIALGELILADKPTAAHEGRILSILSLMSFWLGDLDSSYRQAGEAIEVLSGTDDQVGLAYAQGLSGVLALMGAQSAEPGDFIDGAVTTLDRLGDLYGAASILTGVSWMGVWLGLDVDVSQRAIDAARRCGSTTELAISLCNRSLRLWREGRSDDARVLLNEGLLTARAAASVGLETLALASVVEVAAGSPSPTTAITLVSAIETARARYGSGGPYMRWTGIPLPSLVVARLEAVLALLREEVGASEYQKAWDRGQHITLADATEHALRVLDPQPDQS